MSCCLTDAFMKLFFYPADFKYWNYLPNEIKIMVIQRMDVRTRTEFKACAKNVFELVRKAGKQKVNVCVKFTGKEASIITLEEAESGEKQLEWLIQTRPDRNSTVIYSSIKPRNFILKNKTRDTTTSTILQRILIEPTFIVKKLEIYWRKSYAIVDLGSTSAKVELIYLKGCKDLKSIDSIFKNENLNFNKIIGGRHMDRLILYASNISYYGKIQRQFQYNDYHWQMPKYWANSFELTLSLLSEAQLKVKEFWDITLGLCLKNDLEAAYLLNLPKTTNDFMYFQLAFSYSPYTIPYLQASDSDFDNKISFLREGIDILLSDYQLTTILMVYFLRLLKNKPELQSIQDTAHGDLRLVLKKYENLNYYEKMMTKIEALLP